MLEIKDLVFQPDNEEPILKGINMTIGSSKLVVLTGPNGGGKTTLAKTIAGINEATSGDILLDGESIIKDDITQRAKKGISYAFQQPVRFKGFTVSDFLNIANGAPLSGNDVEDVLSKVGLKSDEYKNRDIDAKLSGGEIKRIEIASVLLRKSKVAIFDEPEAGIDLWSFNSLIRVFETLRDTKSMSMIIISHQERILSIADEIIMIQNGQIGLHGPRSKMFPLICKNDCPTCDGCDPDGGCHAKN